MKEKENENNHTVSPKGNSEGDYGDCVFHLPEKIALPAASKSSFSRRLAAYKTADHLLSTSRKADGKNSEGENNDQN